MKPPEVLDAAFPDLDPTFADEVMECFGPIDPSRTIDGACWRVTQRRAFVLDRVNAWNPASSAAPALTGAT